MYVVFKLKLMVLYTFMMHGNYPVSCNHVARILQMLPLDKQASHLLTPSAFSQTASEYDHSHTQQQHPD